VSFVVLLVFLFALGFVLTSRFFRVCSGLGVASPESSAFQQLLPRPIRSLLGRATGARRMGVMCGALAIVAAGASCPGTQAQTAHFSGAQSTIGSGFSAPNAVVVDGSGNLFIADGNNNRILIETLSGGSYTQRTLATSTLSGPTGLGIDANGNIYVADTYHNRVLKETRSDNGYSETVVDSVNLNGPRQIAVDSSGNLYIADYGNNRIVKETLSGSSYVESVLVTTTSLNGCGGVVVDGSGNVYIADTKNKRVLKETLASGSYTETTVASTGLSDPKRLALDGSGNLFVADGSGNLVFKETVSGSTYSQSTVVTSSLSSPFSVAADGNGTVYIVDNGNNRVLKLQMSGADFGTVAVGNTSSVFSLFFTFDTAGNLGAQPLVTAEGTPGPDFTANSTSTCKTGQSYSAGASCSADVQFTPQLSGIRYGGAVLQGSTGNVIATGYIQGTGSGPQLNFLPSPETSIGSSSLSGPSSATTDKNGNVYIADTNNNRVLKETLSGGAYTESTVASGTLSGPRQVAVDGSGNVYVADFNNNRVARACFINTV